MSHQEKSTGPGIAPELLAELRARLEVPIRTQVPGARLTTFAVGGPIEVLVEPRNEVELSELLRFLGAATIPVRVIGAGSNLLLADAGIPQLVVKLSGDFAASTQIDSGFRVGAAASLMSLTREAAAAGLSGLEFAGGIPASIGGAVCMNAGAHGSEVSQVLESARVVMPTGEIQEIPASELRFGYRFAALPEGAVVTSAEIHLVASSVDRVRKCQSTFLKERRAKQPLALPSAGSVFKNPSADKSAGYLIESVGLKGRRVGGAQVSTLHANWLVNPDKDASSEDVIALLELCQTKVAEQHKIHLEPEIKIWH